MLLSQYTGDADVMDLMDDLPPIAAEENLHPVTCAACHDAHTGELRADSFIVNENSLVNAGVPTDWDPNGNGVPDEFDFCTSCHTYYNQDGDLIGSGSLASGTAPFYHNTAWYRTITTTHYDDPETPDVVEGYVVRQPVVENDEIIANANPCFDCHGHELRTNTANADADPDPLDPDQGSTIYTQWASSGHGGRLLTQVRTAAEAIDCTDIDGSGTPSDSLSRGRCEEVVDAAMMAGVDSNSGDAWVHYDWDATYKADGDDADTIPDKDRADCQGCHTATGAMNYLNDPVAYDPVDNDFSHLSGWVGTPGTISITTGSGQNETLYCWGCHSNAGTGELRNPGAIPRNYSVSAVPVVIPDVGNSNVCINCHGANGNMESYDPVTEDPNTPFAFGAGFAPGSENVTEAHYLVAAATIYAEDTRIGYEYSLPDGTLLDYAPVSYFAHDVAGLNEDSPETGAGPCVACHMETDEGHLFKVVTREDNAITALNATSCVTCHDGDHGNPGLVVEDTTTAFGLQTAAAAVAFLEEEAEGYHQALDILKAALATRDVDFKSSYPYFDTGVDGWINEGVFGAAHNYNYLYHEPGAYAHNRIYVKRLIYDSLDWLDDYNLNGSVSIDAGTYPEAAVWLSARP